MVLVKMKVKWNGMFFQNQHNSAHVDTCIQENNKCISVKIL